MSKKLVRVLLFSILGLVVLCGAVLIVLAWSNRSLPKHSAVVEQLSDLDKARLSEAIHLRQTLGDQVWPGWGAADIPLIVYNEEYAFLVGYPDPPAGWIKVPQNLPYGSDWEAVSGDTFRGESYYRQKLTAPDITPEAFTVLVGDRWVASLGTKEFGLVSFVQGFGEQLPALLRPIFPYRLMWNQLMGESENYIGGLEHESFHAYVGMSAADRLADAERAMSADGSYPWDDQRSEDAWSEELGLLLAAVRSESDPTAAELGRQFLARRDERRAEAALTQEFVDFERQREWLEGLAKYVELEIGVAAESAAEYVPVSEIAADPEFNTYTTRKRFWSRQMAEVGRLSGRQGETRFYYSGMAQAVLLDRLMPDWKSRALQPGVMLEDLLQEAVGQ